MCVHGGEVIAEAEEESLQRLLHLGVDQGRPAGAPCIEQRSDAGASGQAPHLAAPASENAAGDAGFLRRRGIGLAARHSEGDQVLGTADGGKPCTGLVALVFAGAFPRSLVGEEGACFGIVVGAGVGIVNGALAERGCCIGIARPLRGF